MNSSVHCWKNEGLPSCVGARGPRKTPCPAKSAGRAGQAGWILSARALMWAIPSVALLGQVWLQWIAHSPDHTAKIALFVALGFGRFVGESRPSRWVELVETSRR